MCKNCNEEGCIGFYLLHPAEFHKQPELQEKHLKEDPNTQFKLITSPSSGEVFTRFRELHIIQKEETK